MAFFAVTLWRPPVGDCRFCRRPSVDLATTGGQCILRARRRREMGSRSEPSQACWLCKTRFLWPRSIGAAKKAGGSPSRALIRPRLAATHPRVSAEKSSPARASSNRPSLSTKGKDLTRGKSSRRRTSASPHARRTRRPRRKTRPKPPAPVPCAAARAACRSARSVSASPDRRRRTPDRVSPRPSLNAALRHFP